MLQAARVAVIAVLLAGPFVLAFFAGGYFDEPRLYAGVVACALALAGAVLSRRPLPGAAPARLALGGLALLLAWTVISLGWAPLSSNAVADVDRLLLYLAGFAAALALLDTRAAVRAIEPALALGALAVILYGLSERLLPGIFELERDGSAFGRLSRPLTYWNAMGSMAALGLVLAIRLAGDRTRGRRLRVAAAAASPALLLGLWLTFSRGADAAAIAGIVLVALLAFDGAQLRAIAVALGAGVPAALACASFESVRTLEGSDTGGGAAALAILVTLSAVAAVAQLLLVRREGAEPPADRAPLTRTARRLVALGFVGLVLGGIVLSAFLSERRPAAAPTGATTSRLTSIESNRSDYWRVAFDMFAASPLRGEGSGAFAAVWLRERSVPENARDAHSLYVETAAELGLVGLLALALFLGGIAWGASRALARDRAAAAGLAAGFAVWLVHAGVDWIWEMPAVTLTALLLAAGLLARSEA